MALFGALRWECETTSVILAAFTAILHSYNMRRSGERVVLFIETLENHLHLIFRKALKCTGKLSLEIGANILTVPTEMAQWGAAFEDVLDQIFTKGSLCCDI